MSRIAGSKADKFYFYKPFTDKFSCIFRSFMWIEFANEHIKQRWWLKLRVGVELSLDKPAIPEVGFVSEKHADVAVIKTFNLQTKTSMKETI